MRDPPNILSGSVIYDQVKDINVTFGKEVVKGGKRKRKKKSNQGTQQWRKKSIFFELPYWEHNLLRHNLDVMHIEKNVCENIVYTLLNDGKSKDHLSARKDLQEMGFRHDLWPDENGTYPLAIYQMTNQEKKSFLTTLRNITVPDGYSSNISSCIDVDNHRLNGMLKSHDFHILMEQFLPLAMRGSLPDEVSAVLNELSSFFRQLCGKVLNVKALDKLQHDIVLTLCHMEMLFPPSFFTVSVHLIVHLVDEAKFGGPVQYRWMYPIERYLGLLKSYVRNRAQPAGSIAEGYLMQEILTFCSRYLDNIETRWNRPRRVDDVPNDIQPKTRVAELFPQIGKPVGGSSYFTLTSTEKLQAHRHVLTNCPLVDPYLQQFRELVRRQLRRHTRNATEIDKKVHREFVGWFYNYIFKNVDKLIEADKDVLLSLAEGPDIQATRFTGYNVNGYKFRTLARDRSLKTQNSGVFGTFGTRSYSSNRDTQMRFGGVPYYGKLVDIIEINYNGLFMVTLFKCEWANTTNPRGIKKDNLGYQLFMKMSETNALNRQKQTIPHTLGTKTIARKRHELEIETGRSYSRAEMYSISHKKSDGSFVNEEAKQKSDLLEKELEKNCSEEAAYVKVFGKDRSGYVRGMGFGVCPSQVLESASSSSSSQFAGITLAEWNAMKSELQESNAKFQALEERMNSFMQQFGGQGPPNQVNLP